MQRSFSYVRYLLAKETVDERSLNRQVWGAFVEKLNERAAGDLRILEVGGGIGATFRRIAAEPGLMQKMHYTLLDNEHENLSFFEKSVDEWLADLGYRRSSHTPMAWEKASGGLIQLQIAHGDVHRFIEEANEEKWDVIVAQAFLDLFDLDTFLPKLLGLLKSGGIFYFPINFDGVTSFLPGIDVRIDECVERIYHQSMDRRSAGPVQKGRSQSGRRLLCGIVEMGSEIIAAGGSDWVVFPRSGVYAANERYFLDQILQFVQHELRHSDEIEPTIAADWISTRYDQLKKGKLIYIAHQLDLLGAVT